ncbi:MAG: endopeptidase La [Flavobacteriales bacterium]|nr:endopeptidase La [Flavobacteriales bacterium]MCB9192025.1 endopeptidase La [Flavobacteriales bacterium]MCB9204083.1 endopeptidase La [Flavobacteriales bacterium]
MNDPFEDIVRFSNLLEEDSEFIPLLSPEDEESMNSEEIPALVGILPLRNTVLFPGVVIPITIGRDKSIKLIKDAYHSTKTIGVLAQKDVAVEDPTPQDMNSIGTVAKIIKMLQMPDGSTTVIIQGKRRFQVQEIVEVEPYFRARISAFDEIKPARRTKEFNALVDSLKDIALSIIKQSPNIPSESEFALKNIESPSFLINFISSNMDASVDEKQKMLEVADLKQRAEMVLQHLTKNLQMLELKNQIQSKVKVDIDKQQREYFLNQQMKQIQEELGVNSLDQEVEEMRKKASEKKWTKKISEHFQKELDKLGRMNPSAGEYSVQMNYLDTLLELPWGEFTKDNFDIKHAEKILDRDHFGLKKVKERILEHLAVLKLKGDLKAPILCLVGPPGVGKTSLGKSIAEAVGRQYVRVSLGGLKDESEVRGHRKTYIGAMPGRIIQNIKKAKSSNPVFVLDELDKVGSDFHGDPSSALLEVLDPEQNETFYDNYLEVEYDLSKVMFVATANSLSTIQPALRDRLEIIEVSGYTVEEKLEIAKRHLLPKQIKEHGLKLSDVKLNKKVMEKVVEEYTRESGVRGLEKTIAKLVRNRAKYIAMDEPRTADISVDDVEDILGPPRVQKDRYQNNEFAGVVTGLAWTAVGGDILFIESSLSKGKGKLTLTGNLGDVMKESAVIALEYLKAHSGKLGLKPELFDEWNLHIHVPEGATPKDGPSAGITIFTALASLYTQRKVRDKLAMTGEITLRGKVLPVGGIKEKILAAKRAKIKEIILSEENRKDVEEIEQDYLKGLTFHYVKNMDEVMAIALLKQKVQNPLILN